MFKLITIFLLVTSLINLTIGCTCVQRDESYTRNTYCNSSFAGMIRVLKPSTKCDDNSQCYKITVIRHFRGSTSFRPTTLKTANNPGICGVILRENSVYFVVVGEKTSPTTINVGLCTLHEDWTQLRYRQERAKFYNTINCGSGCGTGPCKGPSV